MNSIEKTKKVLLYFKKAFNKVWKDWVFFKMISQEDIVRIKSCKKNWITFECVEVNWKSKMLPNEQRVTQGLGISHFLQRSAY